MSQGTNKFDYTNNVFNHSGAFQTLKFNRFLKAPNLKFNITLEFIQDLEKIKKYRARKEFKLKIRILLVTALAFIIILMFLVY